MRQRLYRLIRLLFPILLVLASGCAGAKTQEVPTGELVPTARQEKTTQGIKKVLERFHYRKVNLDDAFANQIFNAYLKSLDPNRSFFLQPEVDRFQREFMQLDDDLKRGKVDLGFEVFRLYRARVDDRVAYALGLLDPGFDFDRDEEYRYDRAKADWAANPAELDEIWRQRVKNDWLGLRLAKKPDAEIRDLLRKRYDGLARRVRQFDSDDVYQTFVNAFTESLEPHTSYMSPSTAENFDISMRLSLEGIGAVLKSEGDYTVVQRTIPGGPARQSGHIHAGDRIVGVAQGEDGVMEDVIGWRLQDVVDKIAAIAGDDAVFGGELRHRGEHSVEAALIWAHYLTRDRSCCAVPILCGSFEPFIHHRTSPSTSGPISATIKVLRDIASTRRTVIVAAADLAHVGPAFGDLLPLDLATRARLERRPAPDLQLDRRHGRGRQMLRATRELRPKLLEARVVRYHDRAAGPVGHVQQGLDQVVHVQDVAAGEHPRHRAH